MNSFELSSLKVAPFLPGIPVTGQRNMLTATFGINAESVKYQVQTRKRFLLYIKPKPENPCMAQTNESIISIVINVNLRMFFCITKDEYSLCLAQQRKIHLP